MCVVRITLVDFSSYSKKEKKRERERDANVKWEAGKRRWAGSKLTLCLLHKPARGAKVMVETPVGHN